VDKEPPPELPSKHISITSGGFKVGGAEARIKRGPFDDVIILSQP